MALSDVVLQDSDVDIATVPDSPEPYQDVTATLSSYATDLNKAMIVWQSGNKVVLSGIGKISYSFKTLGPNVVSDITATITPEGSLDKITKEIRINPSEIEIFWEGVDSYTPPFYKGKSFISSGGVIKAVAMPTTTKGGRVNAVYNWKNSDNSVQDASGYNKDSYIFANSELNKSENISVNASTVNGGYDTTKEISIPITSPKILFYKKSPTEGVLYNNALTDNTFLSENEITIVAEPYFLAISGNEKDFSYKWQINGEDIDTPTKKTELTVQPTSRGGYATISLVLENLNAFFQTASAQIKLSL